MNLRGLRVLCAPGVPPELDQEVVFWATRTGIGGSAGSRARKTFPPGHRAPAPSGAPEAQEYADSRPGRGNAGIDGERRAAAPEPEDGLQAHAVHPARRTRVPG